MPVTVAMLDVWSGEGLNFVCPRCSILDNPKARKKPLYDMKGELQR